MCCNPSWAAPSAPTGLTGAPGNAKVTLSWTSQGGTGYNVYRSNTSNSYGSTPIKSLTNTSYIDTGLTNNTTYYYIVRATDSSGESGKSNEIMVKPLAPPATPTGITATAGTSKVTISWNSVAQAANYDVLVSTTSGGPYSNAGLDVVGTTLEHINRTNGTTYYYVVRASNIGGNSANSTEVSAMPVAKPTGFTATVANNQATLNWSQAAGATGYKIYRYSISNATLIATITSATTTTYTNTGLTTNQPYTYFVRAYNSTGESDESVEKTVVQLPPPASGTFLVAGQTGKIKLQWAPVGYATSYKVFRATTSNGYGTTPIAVVHESESNPNLTLELTQSGLTNGQIYYYVVRSVDSTGESANSVEKNGTPIAIPTGLNAVASTSKVNLTWAAAAGATKYWVYRSETSNDPDPQAVAVITNPSYSDAGVWDGLTYYYTVSGANANGGEGTRSTQDSAVPIQAPYNLTASGGDGAVTLGWQWAVGADTYGFKRATNVAGPFTTLPSTTAQDSFTDTGLSDGVTYYYKVFGINPTGQSVDSDVISATTVVPAPSGFTARPGNNQVKLTWNVITGSNVTYGVYRSGTSNPIVDNLAPATSTSPTVSFTDSGVTNGTTYTYTVFARRSGFISGNSASVASTPLGTPTNLVVVADPTATNTSNMKLTFNTVPGADSYVIKRSLTPDNYQQVGLASNYGTFIDNNQLLDRTLYFYQVFARKSSESGPNDFLPATGSGTSGPLGPLAPQNVTAHQVANGVELNWTAPAGVTSYEIYASWGGVNRVLAGTVSAPQTTYLHTAALPNTAYTYEVIPFNAAGIGRQGWAYIYTYAFPGNLSTDAFSYGDLLVGRSDGVIDHYVSGTLKQHITVPGFQPTRGITFDASGNLRTAQPAGNKISTFRSDGTLMGTMPFSGVFSLAAYSSWKFQNGDANDFGRYFWASNGSGTLTRIPYESLSETTGNVTSSVSGPVYWMAFSDAGNFFCYSSVEGTNSVVKRQGLPSIVMPIGYTANAVAVLPGRGVLVAAGPEILAYNGAGALIHRYDMPGIDDWTTLALGPASSGEAVPQIYAAGASTPQIFRFEPSYAVDGSVKQGLSYLFTSENITCLAMRGAATYDGFDHGPQFQDRGYAANVPVGTKASFRIDFTAGDYGDVISSSVSGPGTFNGGNYEFTPTAAGLSTVTATVSGGGGSATRDYLINAYNPADKPLTLTTTSTDPYQNYMPVTLTATDNIINRQFTIEVPKTFGPTGPTNPSSYLTTTPSLPTSGTGTKSVNVSNPANYPSISYFTASDTANYKSVAYVNWFAAPYNSSLTFDFISPYSSPVVWNDLSGVTVNETVTNYGPGGQSRSFTPRGSIRRVSDGKYWSGSPENNWITTETLLETVPTSLSSLTYFSQFRGRDVPGPLQLLNGDYQIKFYGASSSSNANIIQRTITIQH